MGLSSYGEPKYYEKIRKNIFKSKNNLNLNLKYFNHTGKNFNYNFSGKPNQSIIFNEKIKNIFEINENDISDSSEITELQMNLASSVQKIFEEKIAEIIKKIDKISFSKNLVYAGGCALNSLANRKFYDCNLFDDIFIPYAPGDGGGAIGAALVASKKKDEKVKFSNLTSPFIGPKYTNKIIDETIKSNVNLKNFKVEKIDDRNKLYFNIAELIYQNKIIGFFNDRMEFGARALGNRSILANPCDKSIKEIINKKIKRRENFRPFAPAILYEEKNKWFSSKKSNPYMSAVEVIKEEKRQYIPAVTHIDGTGRVQTVSKLLNENFYNLINKFFKISGVPVLLNTSFNENEPIVNKPSEAIDCFLRTKMDVLVIENFLIKR